MARLSDQTPLLLEKQMGEGRVVVFASTFDNISNDFPLHASFVPFVEQTAQYLGRLDEGQANLLVGSYLELRAAREQAPRSKCWIRRRRARYPWKSPRGRADLLLTQGGLLRVRRPNGRHELVAVNADRHESDLDVFPGDTDAVAEHRPGGSRGEQADENGERRYVLVVRAGMALALAVAESSWGTSILRWTKRAA